MIYILNVRSNLVQNNFFYEYGGSISIPYLSRSKNEVVVSGHAHKE